MSTAEAWVPEDNFGARLALIRQRLRLNVSQAARKCEISEATWRTWERGSEPQDKAEVVKKIAKATGARATWLMWGGDDPTMTCFGVPSLSLVKFPNNEQMELFGSADFGLDVPHVTAVTTGA